MVGIIISGIMVIMGTFIIEGYYNGKVAVLEKTPKDTLVVKTDSDNVKKLEQNYIDIYDSKYKCMDYSYSIYGCETKGKNFNLECNLIGISNMGNNIMEVLDYNTHITRSILVEGRLINNSDISQKRRVIVINSYVAKIMFNNESALGQYINIDVGNGETKNESFKVIGVIENSKYDE